MNKKRRSLRILGSTQTERRSHSAHQAAEPKARCLAPGRSVHEEKRRSLLIPGDADGKAKPFRTSDGGAESKMSCTGRFMNKKEAQPQELRVNANGKAEPFRTSGGKPEYKNCCNIRVSLRP